jgi:hypothetical protein
MIQSVEIAAHKVPLGKKQDFVSIGKILEDFSAKKIQQLIQSAFQFFHLIKDALLVRLHGLVSFVVCLLVAAGAGFEPTVEPT